MRSPSTRTSKVAIALASPLAILGAAALVWQSSYAAFSSTTRNSGNGWETGAVAVTDDDARLGPLPRHRHGSWPDRNPLHQGHGQRDRAR